MNAELCASALRAALIAYRSYDSLSDDDKEAVLTVLVELLPEPADKLAEVRLYHLQEARKHIQAGREGQMQLDAIVRELDPHATQMQLGSIADDTPPQA